jgi:chromosome segregation ATPase
MNLSQIDARDSELRAKLTDLVAQRDQAIVDGASDNKRVALKKQIDELKLALEDLETLRQHATRQAAAAVRASNVAARRAELEAIGKQLDAVEGAAQALQDAIASLAGAYKQYQAALSSARALAHDARLPGRAISEVLQRNPDLGVCVEFARAEIGHLAQTQVTGSREFDPFPVSVKRSMSRIRDLAADALADLTPKKDAAA